MRTLGHVLLGIILGIVLLVVAVGGAIYGAISLPVGDILDTFNVQVLPPDHVLATQSLLQIIQSVMNDVQNLNSVTISELKTKYGIPLPEEIHGIPLTAILETPIGELTTNPDNAITEVVNSVHLSNILSIAGVAPETLTKFPIFEENMDNNIQDTMNNLTSVLDVNTLTMKSLYDNFGLSLSEVDEDGKFQMELLNQLAYLPISKFANAIKSVNIGAVLDVDSDQFLPVKDAQLFVKVDKYEALTIAELNNKEYKNPNSEKYVYDISAEGKQLTRELRYVKKAVKPTEPTPLAQTATPGTTDPTPVETKYVFDESTYKEGFIASDPADNDKYFRHIVFEEYDPAIHIGDNINFYLAYAINNFVKEEGATEFAPQIMGKIPASSLYTAIDDPATIDVDEAQTLQTYLNANKESIKTGKISTLPALFYKNGADFEASINYSYDNIDPTKVNEQTKLDKELVGSSYVSYAKVHHGTSDMAIQYLAGLTINGLNNPQETLMSLKLGDVIPLEEDNVLYSLANCKIGDIPSQIETLEIMSIMPDMHLSAYIPDDNGGYYYVPATIEEPFGNIRNGYYTIYKEDGTAKVRYKIDSNYVVANKKDLKRGEGAKELFVYNTSSKAFESFAGTPESDKIYYIAAAGSIKADSRLLQRIAHTNIKGISTLMDSIVLGDIMDITEDNILYAFSGCTIAEIPNELDHLKINQVIKNIKVGAYIKNPNGPYVKVTDGTDYYYTVYNPVTHATNTDRYDYYNDYYVASKTDKENFIASKTQLYTFDEASKSFKEVTYGTELTAETVYYVNEPADSKILQRIASQSVNNLGALMNSLVLGDVISINLNTYAPVVEADYTSNNLYFFDETKNLYRHVFFEGSTAKLSDGTTIEPTKYNLIFKVEKEGVGSHTLIKNLATVPVNSIGDAFSSIIDDLLITDILTINTYAKVTTTTSSNDHFIEENKKYEGLAFVQDVTGLYKKTDHTFVEIKDKTNIATTGDIFDFDYQNIITYIATNLSSIEKDPIQLKEKLEGLQLYVKEGENYTYNMDLALYYFGMGQKEKVFVKIKVPDNTQTYKPYNNASKLLYVKTYNGYVLFNGTIPSHMDLPLYLKLSGGQYVTDAINATHAYDGTSVNTINLAEHKVIYLGIDTNTDYFVNTTEPWDGTALSAEKYSKQATYAIEKDGKMVNGFIYHTEDPSAEGAITVNQKISVPLLRAMANSNKPITKLNEILETLTLKDIIEIDPDSILDTEALKNATLSTLSSNFATAFNELTIGRIAIALKINMDSKVLGLIKNITFPDLMSSLTINGQHQLTFDMEKLLGIKK